MRFVKAGAWLCLAAWSVFAAASTAFATVSPKDAKAARIFDISKEPSKADWRYFMKAPEAAREELWTRQARAGHTLGRWAWGWRLGWVRVCGESDRAYCAKILEEALFDKALVVRSEAATWIGRRYDGSGDAAAFGLLERAYKNPKNLRGGKPLFVQQRILHALARVGTPKQRARVATLAGGHPETKAYWTRLEAGLAD